MYSYFMLFLYILHWINACHLIFCDHFIGLQCYEWILTIYSLPDLFSLVYQNGCLNNLCSVFISNEGIGIILVSLKYKSYIQKYKHKL